MQSKKIKVLQVIENGLAVGGVQDIMMAMVKELHREVQFDIIVTNGEPQHYDDEYKKYGNIYVVPREKKYRSLKGVWHLLTDDYVSYLRALQLMRRQKYDAIYCANLFSAGPFLKAASKIKVPVRIVHSMVAEAEHTPWYSKIIYEIRRKNVNKFSTLKLAISQRSADFLYGKNNDAQIVKSPIYGFEDFLQLKHCVSKENKIRILHMGYQSPRKNALFSIDVMKVLNAISPDYHLIIAGHGYPAYIEKIREYIKENNLENVIDFIPHLVNPKEMFENCEAIILPSKNEGIPLTLLEAQAAGIPCFISDCIEQNVNYGLCTFAPIANEGDAKLWAEEIHQYFTQNGITRRQADLSEWSTTEICKQYLKWFKNLQERGKDI